MEVNFARIGRDETQLLDQVQNYSEKMSAVSILTPHISGAGKSQCSTLQVQGSLQGAVEEIPDLIIVCAETQQVLTHR